MHAPQSLQVINAARVLSAKPKSKVASENLDVFASAWRWSVKLLTMAVDEVTNIEDFLAVSEAHIWEDMQVRNIFWKVMFAKMKGTLILKQ